MRDRTIDITRGLCIGSMVIGHIASGSILSALVHPQRWTDAAYGFVFLSGLVLGLVYRRGFDKRQATATTKLVRRSLRLYWIQLGILVLALAVRSVSTRPEILPAPDTHGGWVQSLLLAGSLQLPAPNLTILPMYVVLLLWAVPVFWLLGRGQPWTPVAMSTAVYAVSLFWPGSTIMPYLREDPALQFNWAAWQLPFVVAIVIGWHWQSRDVRSLVLSRPAVAGCAVLFGVVFVLAQADRFGVLGGGQANAFVGRFFAKFDLGPGAVLYGTAGLVVMYWVIHHLLRARWAAWPLAQLEAVGRHSLSSFILLCLAVILLPAVFRYEESGIGGMVAALGVFVACVIWSRHREARKRFGQASAAQGLLASPRPAAEVPPQVGPARR